METLLIVGQWLLPVFYLVLVLDYGVAFITRTPTKARQALLPTVVTFHLTILLLRYLRLGYLPLLNPFEILTLVAISITIVYCIMELAGQDQRVGVFIFLVVFLMQYSSSVFLGQWPIPQAKVAAVQLGPMAIHTVSAIFAYTSLAMSAVHGALQIVGRRDIRNRRFGLLFDRLPPLENLSRASWYCLAVALIFITISVVTGAIAFGHTNEGMHHGAMTAKIISKIILGLETWLICAIGVLGKAFGKWDDSKITYIASGGFMLIVIMFVISLALS